MGETPTKIKLKIYALFISSFEDSSHENLLDTATRLLFLVVFISFYISGYDFSQVLELHSILSEKKIFVANFPF